jgi:hypothetical protein
MERDLLQCDSSTPEELLRFSGATLPGFQLALEHLKIPEKHGLREILLLRGILG